MFNTSKPPSQSPPGDDPDTPPFLPPQPGPDLPTPPAIDPEPVPAQDPDLPNPIGRGKADEGMQPAKGSWP